MKPITLSKNSWHYRMLSFAHMEPWEDTDLCSYMWRVFFAAIFMLIIFVFVVLCVAAVGDASMWLLVMALYGVLLEPHTVVVPVFIALIVGSLVGIVWLIVHIPHMSSQEPGFVRMAYRSVKDRVCYRVEFK